MKTMGINGVNIEKTDDPVAFEEALNRTGNGAYNILLSVTCAWILMSIGVELFGFSMVVTAACDLKVTVAQQGILTSLPFLGIILVSYLWGYVADTKGRRFTLVLVMSTSFVISCLTSLAPNWQLLGLGKFFSVCFSCAANSVTYTTVGESCVQRVRNKYMLLMTSLLLIAPAVAAVITFLIMKLNFAVELPWTGIFFKPWRLLIIAEAFPAGIGALAIYFFYESPKFLANLGKTDEALKVLKSIHRINHRYSNDVYTVQSLILEEKPAYKQQSLLRSVFEQSAPIFRPPFLKKTLQLFFIVAVVYMTNNSFIVWLPRIMSLVGDALKSGNSGHGNICSLISTNHAMVIATTESISNTTIRISPVLVDIIPLSQCHGKVDNHVLLTLGACQATFSTLNFALSYLPRHRRTMLIIILSSSALSGVLLNLAPEPISSVFFFLVFTCTCLAMGILASFFVDIYPTSCRGMVSCLSVMVARSSAFIGINLVGKVIFEYCELSFYVWAILVFSSVVAAWYLPRDNPASEEEIQDVKRRLSIPLTSLAIHDTLQLTQMDKHENFEGKT